MKARRCSRSSTTSHPARALPFPAPAHPCASSAPSSGWRTTPSAGRAPTSSLTTWATTCSPGLRTATLRSLPRTLSREAWCSSPRRGTSPGITTRPTSSMEGNGYHAFGANDTSLAVDKSLGLTVILQWNDPFDASGTDYDLFVCHRGLPPTKFNIQNGLCIVSSRVQDGDDSPYEVVSTSLSVHSSRHGAWTSTSTSTPRAPRSAWSYSPAVARSRSMGRRAEASSATPLSMA